MSDNRHISAKQYYDFLPPQNHRCGDIWTGLDANNLLGSDNISGIVVTPACDLSQGKTETVTYLPIVPVRAYYSMPAVLPEITAKVTNIMSSLSTNFSVLPDTGFLSLQHNEVEALSSEIDAYLASKQRGVKEQESLQRACAGLRIIKKISAYEISTVDASDIEKLYGSEWKKILNRIITNAYSASLHFLPADRQPTIYSGVPSHSLVLMRYPITIPVTVLDLAGESTEATWPDVAVRYGRMIPAMSHYKEHHPIKCLTLRGDFLADLLTRYVGMFNRLGSPDFTLPTINRIASEV